MLNEDLHVAPSGHPENPSKLSHVIRWLDNSASPWLLEVNAATTEQNIPAQIHTPHHLATLKNHSRTQSWFDPDTYLTKGSWTACNRVIAAACDAVTRSVIGEQSISFVLCRPPGHHAESDRAMGFCLVNNVAIAAQHALTSHGLNRVAIVDFDVHHGNGTQEIFYSRSDVLFISLHQYPFWPGTGGAHEQGTGTGKGFTLNCPMDAGSTDADYNRAFQTLVVPKLESFKPQLLLVSAGFDAHRDDYLGGCEVTGEGFRSMAQALKTIADSHCQGCIVSLLEGGYNPAANLESIQSYLEGLAL